MPPLHHADPPQQRDHRQRDRPGHDLSRHHGSHHAGPRRPRGFAGFGHHHGAAGDSGGLDSLRRGRKLGSADLQLLLLALLADRPSHGYELIHALDERSSGYYCPSPGMVYPALTYLEEIGHAHHQALGARKLYTVTQAGLTQLEQQRANADALLEQLAWFGRRMTQLRQAVAGGDGAGFDPSVRPGSQAPDGRGAGGPEVRAARHSLKLALIESSGADAAQQQRIAEILRRAADDIRRAQS